MEPPGPAGYIDGTNPYFFSVGQSAGPIRSNPLQPRRAASRQQSSRDMLRANTPRVTLCFSRPLRLEGVTAGAWVRAKAAPVRVEINSLRCIYPPFLFRYREPVKRVARGDDEVLRFIQLICDR